MKLLSKVVCQGLKTTACDSDVDTDPATRLPLTSRPGINGKILHRTAFIPRTGTGHQVTLIDRYKARDQVPKSRDEN
jgi:hypothetical protein